MKLRLPNPVASLTRRLRRARSALYLLAPPSSDLRPPGKRSFLFRLSPAVFADVPRHLAALAPPAARLARHALARRELAFFDGNVDTYLAAVGLTCRPSTLKTKAAVIGAVFPEHRAATRRHINYAAKMMMTERGKPQHAKTFPPEALRAAIASHPDARVARAARILWVTCGRAADLQHFSCEKVSAPYGLLWKISFLSVVRAGRLHAPKSDLAARRLITKWIPQDPAFDPTGLNAVTWAEINLLTKRISPQTTPHSIRQSATRFLEQEGFSEVERAALTGHAVAEVSAPGIRAYTARGPMDPMAILSVRQARILISALRSTDTRPRW